MFKVIEKSIGWTELTSMIEEKVAKHREPYFVFSDIHIADHPKFPDYQRCCVALMKAVTHWCGPSLFLGDFFDKPQVTPSELTTGSEVLRSMWQPDSIMVAGNHVKDRYDRDDIVDVLLSISDIRHCRPSTPTVVSRVDADFHVIPYHPDWINDTTTLKPWLNPLDNGKPQIVMLHGPLLGARYDNGVLSEVGARFESDMFDGFDLVLAGDYHTPQKVDLFNVPFYYVGAPFQFNFGHKFNPVIRFMWIDSELKAIRIYTVKTADLFENTPDIGCVMTRFVTINLDEDVDAWEKVVPSKSSRILCRVVGTLNEQTDLAMAAFKRFSTDAKEGRIQILDGRTTKKLTDSVDMSSDTDTVVEFMESVAAMTGSDFLDATMSYFLASLIEEERESIRSKLMEHLQ